MRNKDYPYDADINYDQRRFNKKHFIAVAITHVLFDCRKHDLNRYSRVSSIDPVSQSNHELSCIMLTNS